MAMPLSVPRCTLEDLESFPDDGNRYEVVDGILLVTPAQNRETIECRTSTGRPSGMAASG
jgi:hypothetical protein